MPSPAIPGKIEAGTTSTAPPSSSSRSLACREASRASYGVVFPNCGRTRRCLAPPRCFPLGRPLARHGAPAPLPQAAPPCYSAPPRRLRLGQPPADLHHHRAAAFPRASSLRPSSASSRPPNLQPGHLASLGRPPPSPASLPLLPHGRHLPAHPAHLFFSLTRSSFSPHPRPSPAAIHSRRPLPQTELDPASSAYGAPLPLARGCLLPPFGSCS